MIDSDFYAIDIDAELIVGGGYEAHFVISVPNGDVIVRRRLNRRFDTYSAALMAAYESGRLTIDSWRIQPTVVAAVPAMGASMPGVGIV